MVGLSLYVVCQTKIICAVGYQRGQKKRMVIDTKAICVEVLGKSIAAHLVLSVIITANLARINVPSASKTAVNSDSV